MSRNLSHLPLTHFDIEFQQAKPIHRLTLKKRIFKLRSLNSTVKTCAKGECKQLDFAVKAFRFACFSPKSKPLKAVQNAAGGKSLVQSCERCCSPKERTIVVNSVLGGIPLKIQKRPVSAFCVTGSMSKEKNMAKRRNKQKVYSLKSDIASIEDLFSREKSFKNKMQ